MTIRASDNYVYLVWVRLPPDSPVAVYYSRSIDGGQTWSGDINFTLDSLGSQRCYVAVEDTHVVVSWMGYKYSPYAFTGDFFIKQSFDGGQTWNEEQVLTDMHKVWMGSVYIEDSLIVATWQDDRHFDGENNSEIYVRYSLDYGQTWTEEERLSFGDYHSHSPIACKTGDKIHILWGDQRAGASGLYYCYNDLATTIDDNNLLPDKTQLLTSYPNPFNSTTLIAYKNIEGGDIDIYDITGRLVTTLVLGDCQEGSVT